MCTTELDLEVLGRLGYDAYGDFTGWKDFRGDPMPTWAELPAPQREAWYAGASAMYLQAARDLRPPLECDHTSPASAYAASHPPPRVIPDPADGDGLAVVVTGGVAAGPAGCCRDQSTPHVDGLPPARPSAPAEPLGPATVVGHPRAAEPGGRA